MSVSNQNPMNEKKVTQALAPGDSVPETLPEVGENLSDLLDEQAKRILRRRKRANWVILAFFGLLMGSGSVWYEGSAANRQKVSNLILDFKSSKKDLKMLNPMTVAHQYDTALQKIGGRAKEIDQAAAALGVDPNQTKEDVDEAGSKATTGSDAQALAERNRLLQQKAGGLAKGQTHTAGPNENPDTPAASPAATPAAAKTTAKAAAPAKPATKVLAVPVARPASSDEPVIIEVQP